MNILAVDTSGPVAGVALLAGDQIVYEGMAVNRFTHSVNLMPMVEEGFERTALTLPDIDLFACVTGPGSFTGVRIGVSTIKGMAHGAKKPCIAINALEALASNLYDSHALLCPIQDARAGQVYGAVFASGMPPARLMEDQAIKLPDFLKNALSLAKEGQPLCFVGDGVPVHRQAIIDTLGNQALFAPAHLGYLRPASVAMLALSHEDQATDYLSLQPHYLRAPQAERARMAMLEREGKA